MVGTDAPPVVSIVLPTYNGERYLAESCESCLSQTLDRLELVVVDDGSGPVVRRIVEGFPDPRVRYLRHPSNRGLASALNTGFASARGQYLTWTSDDNRYHRTALQRLVAHLESHPELGLVYAGCRTINEWGQPDGVIHPLDPQSLWTGNCVRACFLYRREVLVRVGEYDPALPLVEDYDYWLRTARTFRLDRLDEILYDVRVHPRRLTLRLSLEQKRESHRKALAKLGDPAIGPPVSAARVRLARASMHLMYGRDFFAAGMWVGARRDLWAAIRLQPSYLLDWTIVRLLLRSLAGDRRQPTAAHPPASGQGAGAHRPRR